MSESIRYLKQLTCWVSSPTANVSRAYNSSHREYLPSHTIKFVLGSSMFRWMNQIVWLIGQSRLENGNGIKMTLFSIFTWSIQLWEWGWYGQLDSVIISENSLLNKHQEVEKIWKIWICFTRVRRILNSSLRIDAWKACQTISFSKDLKTFNNCVNEVHYSRQVYRLCMGTGDELKYIAIAIISQPPIKTSISQISSIRSAICFFQ